MEEAAGHEHRFDIQVMAERLTALVDWLTGTAARAACPWVALQEILLPAGALPAGDATPEPSPVRRTP